MERSPRHGPPFADATPPSYESRTWICTHLPPAANATPKRSAMDSFTPIIVAAPVAAEQPAVPVDAETGSSTKQQGCVVA
jgi:hypothetical protein